MAFNQPQMKNGPVLLSPNVIECGKLVRSHPAATECEVDLALMARSDERAQTLDTGGKDQRRLRGRAYPAPPAPQQAADLPMACASWIGGQGTSP